MITRTKFYTLLTLAVILGTSGQALALRQFHYHEEQGIRAESMRRNIALIPLTSARTYAARAVGSVVLFKDIELKNGASDFPGSSDFRPVYALSCAAGGGDFYVVIDASTGKVLQVRRSS